MSFTYVDVLRAARDTCPYFDFRRIPGGTAARLASDIQRDLVAKLVKRDPERLATTQTLTGSTVVAALAVAGAAPLPVALNPALQYVRLIARYSTGSDPEILTMIAPHELPEYVGERACYLEGSNAYFSGQPADWSQVSTVDVVYVPWIPDIAALTDVLIVPDTAKSAFSSALAFAFARRCNGSPFSLEAADQSDLIRLDVTAFAQTAAEAERQWLATISDQRRKVRGTIREG